MFHRRKKQYSSYSNNNNNNEEYDNNSTNNNNPTTCPTPGTEQYHHQEAEDDDDADIIMTDSSWQYYLTAKNKNNNGQGRQRNINGNGSAHRQSGLYNHKNNNGHNGRGVYHKPLRRQHLLGRRQRTRRHEAQVDCMTFCNAWFATFVYMLTIYALYTTIYTYQHVFLNPDNNPDNTGYQNGYGGMYGDGEYYPPYDYYPPYMMEPSENETSVSTVAQFALSSRRRPQLNLPPYNNSTQNIHLETTRRIRNSEDVPYWKRRWQLKTYAMTRTEKEESSTIVVPDAPLHIYRFNQQPKDSGQNKKAIMSIITATRTVNQTTSDNNDYNNYYQNNHRLPLRDVLIPSLAKTITDVERKYWQVQVYVAVDDNDEYWTDYLQKLSDEKKKAKEELQLPDWLSITFAVYPNHHRIPFNEVAWTVLTLLSENNDDNDENENAHNANNMDYFCRVNDDTKFISVEWMTKSVRILQNYDPPNIGVVGPKCEQGKSTILTHDMVHYSHLEIFNGWYYPSVFENWYLDDWITNVYDNINRKTVVDDWYVDHVMYETRYTANRLSVQWLAVEYEKGHEKIKNYVKNNYPNSTIVIPDTLPMPKHTDPLFVKKILKALPKNGNLLVWGVDQDSYFWHRATTGRVVFLEDMERRIQTMDKYSGEDNRWRVHVLEDYPFLDVAVVRYWTRPDIDDDSGSSSHNDTYDQFVVGQNLDRNNWCDLEMELFPDHIRETQWDVIIVDAPFAVDGEYVGQDDMGPGAFQSLYMTKVLVSNQTGIARKQSEKLKTHIFIDDFERKYERNFSQLLFDKNARDVWELDNENGTAKAFGHFVIDTSDRIAKSMPYCKPPPIQDPAFYPESGELGEEHVRAIMKHLPRHGNLLVFGLGTDSPFWHNATNGRVVFLEDKNRELEEDQYTPYFDAVSDLYPELEVYQISYSTQNNPDSFEHFVGHPEHWAELELRKKPHGFPDLVTKIAWDVILINGPLGCCDSGPGRFQPIYMSQRLAELTQRLSSSDSDASNSVNEVVSHVFVHDFDRSLESELSKQVFDKSPREVVSRMEQGGGAFYDDVFPYQTEKLLGHFVLEKSDFALHPHVKRSESVRRKSTVRIVRDRSDFPENSRIPWDLVDRILGALAEDGNLLLWGLGSEIHFWQHVTKGRVVFLDETLSPESRLAVGKDQRVEMFQVNYTSSNAEELFKRLHHHPERWGNKLKVKNFPSVVLEIRWDAIVVGAPMVCCNDNARFQSLYMTKVLAMNSKAASTAHRDAAFVPPVHVFVDNYDTESDKEFSLELFGREPVDVASIDGHEMAWFMFGSNKNRLIPWDYPKAHDESSPLKSPSKWIVLVEVNDGYFDFFMNWLFYFDKLKTGLKVHVVAEDDAVKKKLQKKVLPGRPYMSLDRSALSLDTRALTYDEDQYNQMVSARASHILQNLRAGLNVLYTDVDTVWLSNPLPYLAFDKSDIVLEVDNPSFNGMNPYYCTGFMAILSNPRTRMLMADWQRALQTPQLNQPVFNEILHKRSTVRHQPLPSLEFPSGDQFFSESQPSDRKKAVIVHNNYVIGKEKKIDRFVNHGLWKHSSANR